MEVEFMVHYVALINRPDLKFSPHKSFITHRSNSSLLLLTLNQLGTLAKLILCELLQYTGDVQSDEKHFSFIRHFIFIFAFHSSSTTKTLVSLYTEA